MTQNPGGLYVMMIIWAGIYFGVGAVFEYLEPLNFIAELIYEMVYDTRFVKYWVADPDYNFTLEQMREDFAQVEGWNPATSDSSLELKIVSMTRSDNMLLWDRQDYRWHDSIPAISNYINRHADTVWSAFCVVGCFVGLMNVHKERADNGVHGIPEFKDIQ